MKNYLDDIAVVIPVREGSSRIKDKVILPFTKGLNLLEWKIEQLKQVTNSKNIFVSTDSDRLKEIAIQRGVEIQHRESKFCIGHQTSFSEVIQSAVKDIPFKHIAWVTVVVPLMKPEEYLAAFQKYQEVVIDDNTYDSLVAVNLMKEYLWKEGLPLNYAANKNHTVSQDLPDIFKVTNGLYMYSKELIEKNKYFLGERPFMFEVSKKAGIDIDLWEDYEFSLAMLNFY